MKGRAWYNFSMRKLLKRVVCFVMAVVLGVSSSIPAFADNPCSRYPKNSNEYQQCWIEFAGQNNILFYDPAGGGTDCAPSTINGNSVTIIGDSISYGARSEYSAQIPNADFESKTFNGTTYNLTEISKHFKVSFTKDGVVNHGGMTIAQVLQEQGELRPYLVFALGTNDPGAVTESLIGELMDLVGTNRKVVLVTNYAYENKLDYTVNNESIRKAGEKYSNVAVADWAKKLSEESNPLKYIGDEYVHPNAEGSKLFVSLVKQALDSLAGGSGGISTNHNTNYAGSKVWSDEELGKIQSYQSVYQEAADKYNFPWPVLAVLHSHETNLRLYNPDNGQGVYQLYVYTDGGQNENRFEPAESITMEEFRRQTLIAAEVVSNMVEDLNNPDNVKRLFFKYNGVADRYIEKAIKMGFSREQAENGEGSPYVMNRYDAARDPDSAEMSPFWPGRFVKDGVYDENSTAYGFGAFVQYEALAGSGFCSSGQGKIADTAINLAWSVEEWNVRGGNGGCKQTGSTLFPHSWCEPKPEYEKAMKEVDLFEIGVSYSPGSSCDRFVATVMRYSGADPGFKQGNVSGQYEYITGRPDMYMKVDAKSTDDLQPGDIFISDGEHIVMYVGVVDGKETVAEASWEGYTGRLSNTSSYIRNLRENGKLFDSSDRYYDVFRRINWDGQ